MPPRMVMVNLLRAARAVPPRLAGATRGGVLSRRRPRDGWPGTRMAGTSTTTGVCFRLPPRVGAAALSTSRGKDDDDDDTGEAVVVPTAELVRVGGGDEGQQSKSESIVVYALLGNLLIMSAKGAVALSSGSQAMTAETVHSAVDAGNQALLLVGLRAAALKPSATHQYGHGKETGDSTSLQRECSRSNAREERMARSGFAPRDDRSSKHEPRRVEHDRDTTVVKKVWK